VPINFLVLLAVLGDLEMTEEFAKYKCPHCKEVYELNYFGQSVQMQCPNCSYVGKMGKIGKKYEI